MPLQSRTTRQGKGLCLLSLDAGGSRAISQLKILAELMHRLNFDVNEDQKQRPCDVFDMIGGTSRGGGLMILQIHLHLLVVFKLTTEQALDEFIDLSVNIMDRGGVDATARTAALETHIDSLLMRHEIEQERRLLGQGASSGGCKLVVPISYKSNLEALCILRNFEPRQGQTPNLAIAQALLATLAIPPLFTSTTVFKGVSVFEYRAGDSTRGNPARQILSEASHTYGPEEKVACLRSVGCGHMSVISTPNGSDHASWYRILEKLIMNSEQEARRIEDQTGHLGIYYRFRVDLILQDSKNNEFRPTPGDILAHTAAHLSDPSVSRNVDLCLSFLIKRDGTVSSNQLKHDGEETFLPTPLPPLTKTFVMRKEPWEFVEKAMLGSEETEGPRMLAVTGLGGCGKTQLVVKFMHVHKSKYKSTLFIDGSSESQIRADILRHVRSSNSALSQMTFEECLLFLAQPTSELPQLLVYDNADDPGIDLRSLLPQGSTISIIITSRNQSIGELCPEAYLELDKMAMSEAVELLLYTANPSPITDEVRQDAHAVADALGCLPIALQQARSYMFQTKSSARAFLERLKTSRERLLTQSYSQQDGRYLSAYAAFEATINNLSARTHKFLQLLSLFRSSKFPTALIPLAAEYNFSDYRSVYIEHGDDFDTGRAMLEEIFLVDGKWDANNLDDLLISLQNYSLIVLSPGVGTTLLQQHTLLHSWMLSSLSEEALVTYQSTAVLLVALGDRSEYTPVTQYLAGHIAHLSPVWDQLDCNNAVAFGVIMRNAGIFKDAVLLHERAVSKLMALRDQSRAIMLYLGWELASTYADAGRAKEAMVLREKILRLARGILGERHPDTINALNNLANTYRDLGRLDEAKGLEEEVLKLRKEILGDRHPETISAFSNLALTYHNLGRLNEAKVLQAEVLKLRRDILEDHHPDTINAFNNLANTYRDLGRLEEAKGLEEEVLKLRKEILGDRHPETINASSNLALTYHKLGRREEAKELREEVLKLMREVLGDHHPDTISASNNLANTYHILGRLEEAKVLQEEVLKVSGLILGDRHPKTISASNNLANTYHILGRLEEAKALQEDVLKLSRDTLGHRHPKTCRAMLSLSETYEALGKSHEAIALIHSAEPILIETLGASHPLNRRCQRVKIRIQGSPDKNS